MNTQEWFSDALSLGMIHSADTASAQSFWHFTAGLPYKIAVISCPKSHQTLPSCWAKHHLTVWLNKRNPGKLMALLPPLVLNDPTVSVQYTLPGPVANEPLHSLVPMYVSYNSITFWSQKRKDWIPTRLKALHYVFCMCYLAVSAFNLKMNLWYSHYNPHLIDEQSESKKS